MLTLDEILEMTPEEFSKNWKNNNIQDSSLKLLGCLEMTDEEKKYVEDHE